MFCWIYWDVLRERFVYLNDNFILLHYSNINNISMYVVELKIKIPSFAGSSYLIYTSLGKKLEKSFSISLVLKPKSTTGLILFSGQHDTKLGDFVSLALKDGKVEYMFDCGSGPVLLR